MTVLNYRGVSYSQEEEQKKFTEWWQGIHRPVVWLEYRGIKYRPFLLDAKAKSRIFPQ